jgi:hypothetical protein
MPLGMRYIEYLAKNDKTTRLSTMLPAECCFLCFVTKFVLLRNKFPAKTVLGVLCKPRLESRGYKYATPTELICVVIHYNHDSGAIFTIEF